MLDATVESYDQYVQLTRDRYEGGVASMGDVALAQTQLETARAQLADLGIPRAQFEHAIAMLTGKPPSELSMPPATNQSPPPVLLVGLPSTLLERRPDVAAAERQVAAANEQVGVAKAAFYPSLSFGSSAGSQAAAIVDLLTVPTRLWSVGAQLAETLFDAGKRRAEVRLTQAAYDATVANYRQTVLTGFQQVEDSLAELRILFQEAEIVERTVTAAQQSLDIATVQYREGLANYLQVITAQTSVLQNQRATVDILTREDVSEVLAELRRDGVSVKILTGDNPIVARHVCRSIGLGEEQVVAGDDIEGLDDGALGTSRSRERSSRGCRRRKRTGSSSVEAPRPRGGVHGRRDQRCAIASCRRRRHFRHGRGRRGAGGGGRDSR